jgi:hypothetical protein
MSDTPIIDLAAKVVSGVRLHGCHSTEAVCDECRSIARAALCVAVPWEPRVDYRLAHFHKLLHELYPGLAR